MRKLSIICLWAYIVFLVLSFLFGCIATVLRFVSGEIVQGFSDLLWTCICGWVLFATVGVKAHEKENEQHDR